MRRLLLLVCLAATAVAVSAAGASAGHSSTTVVIHVCSTSVDWANVGHYWSDSGGGTHVRGLPVYNQMYLDSSQTRDCGSLAGGDSFGPIFYSEWANLRPDGSSTAGCKFSLSSPYGAFQGECNGSLASGHLVGHAGGGSTLKGTYELIYLASDLSSSEYRLTITFNSHD
jgi:hypothetical protein